jgi:hypothetical protein
MAAQVVWSLDLQDAEELWDFLHHNRPGGYQHVNDELAEAIAQARKQVTRCADCGDEGEMTGHMGCQYPKDRD